jgi:3-methyladenine DNA glycosylase/8-oxoguanine DNA glycosylase
VNGEVNERQVEMRAAAPFLLSASSGPPDLTRRFRGGVLELAYPTAAGPASARVWQLPDGALRSRIQAPDLAAAAMRLRELLWIDLDHRPFLSLAEHDPLLQPLRHKLAGMRPARLGTHEHALIRGVAGQLVRWSDAQRFERRILFQALPRVPKGALRQPPGPAEMRRLSPAMLERAGLSPARAVALARASAVDWAAMEGDSSTRIAARVRSFRSLGPWTASSLLLHGFGRLDHGLAGDLGLIRIVTRLQGSPASVEDTQRLLEGYGPWQGLASVWLLHHPLAARHPSPSATEVAIKLRH